MADSRREGTIVVQGKPVPFTIEGQGPIPCLFIGPGSSYIPDMSDDAKQELFTFYDADRYFTYPMDESRVSREEINELTLDSYVEYYESVRKALKLDKVALMGSSAAALVADAYAKKYPGVITQVFMLGTPSTTKDLMERQGVFFEANYNPFLHPKLKTDASSEKWERFHRAQFAATDKAKARQKAEGEEKEKAITTEEKRAGEALVEGVLAAQERYSVSPESEDTLRHRWGRFNTTMQGRFFGGIIPNYEMKGESKVPTLVLSGLHDGIAPHYDVADKIASRTIYGNVEQVILDDVAHDPHRSSQFTKSIKSWLRRQELLRKQALEKATPTASHTAMRSRL